MGRKQLQYFKSWFDGYVKGFYSDDAAVQAGIILKENHTRRVCGNIVRIGASLDLGTGDLILAETIGLFHDIGRFRQFALHRTFNDRQTENHALLGLRELERAGVLSGLAEEERDIITKAIGCHNMLGLPGDLPGRHLLFARLIRDADKLDILEMSAAQFDRPVVKSFLPDTPGYSPVLVDNLLQQKRCSYDEIKNANDRKLLLLSWIYDINFPYTLSEIDRNGYMKKILDTLPGTEDIRAVHRHLQVYIDMKISAAGS